MSRPSRLIALAALICPLLALPAAAGGQTVATKPTLIVALSVDQFSGDLFTEYRPLYTGGLKRLANGAVFPRGYQSHAATETCPGHSTILTGNRPARTGIIANNWIDQRVARAQKEVYCAEDESRTPADGAPYVASPVHLKVPTLGGRMKAADPATRVISVAGKDRAAIMMGGATADQVWWQGAKGFMSYEGVPPTALVSKINAGILDVLAKARPAMPVPAACTAKDYPVAIGGGRQVGTGRFARQANDYPAFRASPESDAATLALATALIEDLALGRKGRTDIISIGLSANDYIGHGYGTEGLEMCLQQMALDQALGDFFARLDRSGMDYLVVLTADHGGHDLPERSADNAQPDEQRMLPALTLKSLNAALATKLKLGTDAAPLLGEIPGDIHASTALPPAKRAKLLREAAAMLRADPQVEAIFSKSEIAAAPTPAGPPENWTLLQRARASFDAERSGDLLVMLKPAVTPIVDPTRGFVATHGSPWDMDRRVPILFWRKGMRPFEQPLSIETVDIMPTLAAAIGLAVPPGEIDGRCRDLIAGPGNSCP